MKFRVPALAMGASLLVLGPAAVAQAQQPAPGGAPGAEGAVLGEIVVTARRRSESLQDAPLTVNAVTADTLQKLNIRQFQDIQSVVPGLNLNASTSGFQSTASLRGVTFAVNTGTRPTVAFYLNDAAVELNFLFQSLFDIGQIEVLKGPQGTTRGVSAPSGAITITTHKPNLSEFGGYADVTLTDLQGRNAQGAINIPIVKDVLGLRVAALIDDNAFNGVRSIHSAIRPRSRTDAVRVSVSFEPSDLLKANITYQHLDNDLTTFSQVSGPGQGTLVNPALQPLDRAAVQDSPDDADSHDDVVTAQVDSRIFGQHLSYVGSYSTFKVHNVAEGGSPPSGDVGNILPGIALAQDVHTNTVETTQEIRLASDPAPGRFLDYTVGAYYSWFEVGGHVVNPGPLLPGAFGDVRGLVNLAAFDPAYQVPLFIDIPSTRQETSLFGSVTLHLGPNTELSGGIRHIWSVNNNRTSITTGDGMLNLGALGLPATTPCSVLGGTAGANPGDCVLHSARVISDLATRSSETPNIYNVSLSHHVTRDFLVYATTGTAYRPPASAAGLQGALAASSIPTLRTLSFHPSERSRSYEVGFKSTWLDDRARLNVALFRQRFHNFTVYIPGVFYANTITTPPQPTNTNFTQSVDALVQGFDIDAALQVTREWNVSAQMSYADGKIQGSLVPCNITDAAGRPVFNTGGLVSLCPGGSASRLPLWNATFQSAYTHPVSDTVDGFLRLLATYYPENKRAEPDFVVPGYGLVNLYLGVRSHDGAWEASIFARNAFNAQRALDVFPTQPNINSILATTFPQLIHPAGYFQTAVTARREVGVNVHYAWGSR